MARVLNRKWVARMLPRRHPRSHKGDNGKVLVLGGSERFVGAPALAALAALRSGADIAAVAAPERVAWCINSFAPDLITLKLPGRFLTPRAVRTLGSSVERFDSVVVGPGIGDYPAALGAVRALLARLKERKVVVDADALRVVPHHQGRKEWVLTPHRGEFERLLGRTLSSDESENLSLVKKLATKLGATILLKSYRDLLAAPDGSTAVNSTGNPGMTVGGTGDALAGIIGAFMAQGLGAFEAACVGAWICGRAGDLCLREKGFEFLASDVIEKIPKVLMELRRVQ